jgi:L-alanine-DL-glutamate epimerase-like enolase superfamily enzyme
MGALRLTYRVETHRLAAPFRISGFVFESSDVVVVELTDGLATGQGEAAGVYYLNDNAPQIVEALEAKREGTEARRIAGIGEPKALITTFSLGAVDPAAMAEGARRYADAKAIKVKLTGDLEEDCARIRAIRSARPDVWLGVDANQGFTRDQLDALVDVLQSCRVSLLEQPLKRGSEAELEGYRCPIPIAADESALDLDDVAGLVGRFDVVNIKLDKCGGLTEALMIAGEARRLGLGVMVGNMVGTSLAMAPAFILGQRCEIVDLDGPTFLREDRTPSCEYRDGTIFCSDEVWGSRAAA